MPVEVYCSWCGEPKLVKPSYANRFEDFFCCIEHKAIWQSAVRMCDNFDINLSNHIKCDYCQTEIYRKSYKLKNNKNNFCCLEHKNLWLKENAPRGEDSPIYSMVEVNCANCASLILKRPCDLERCENLFCDSRCCGEWKSKNLIGEKSPTWNGGKVKTKCCSPECDNDIFVFPYKLKTYANNFCGIKCRNVWQKYFMTGEGSPSWNGGSSLEEYPKEFSKELKEIIRERDEFICQECGCKEDSNENLSIHHIDHDKQNCSFYNLISLCRTCHGYTNFNIDYWQEKYIILINKNIEIRR